VVSGNIALPFTLGPSSHLHPKEGRRLLSLFGFDCYLPSVGRMHKKKAAFYCFKPSYKKEQRKTPLYKNILAQKTPLDFEETCSFLYGCSCKVLSLWIIGE